MLTWVAISRKRKNLRFEGTVTGVLAKNATQEAKKVLIQKAEDGECIKGEIFQVHIFDAEGKKLDAFGVSAKPARSSKPIKAKRVNRNTTAGLKQKLA